MPMITGIMAITVTIIIQDIMGITPATMAIMITRAQGFITIIITETGIVTKDL